MDLLSDLAELDKLTELNWLYWLLAYFDFWKPIISNHEKICKQMIIAGSKFNEFAFTYNEIWISMNSFLLLGDIFCIAYLAVL